MAYVQGNSATGFGTSIGAPFLSNNTAGNLLVYGGNGHSNATSITDTFNTPLVATNNDDVTNNLYTNLYYVENCAAGANTGTRNHASDDATIIVAEYSGALTSGALDKIVQTGQGFSTSPSSGATATTTQPNELIVGLTGFEGAGSPMTPGGTYTERVEAAGVRPAQMEDKTVSATGTYTADGTITLANWCCSIATFKLLSTPRGGGLLMMGVGN